MTADLTGPLAKIRAAPRHRKSPARRSMVRSVAVPLVAVGLVTTVLGIGGWTLVDHAVQRHNASLATSSGQQPGGPGEHGPAAQAPGPVRHIKGSAPKAGAGRIAKPVWLVIPAIGVSTTLVRLGLTAQHTLEVPPTAAVAGWYKGSPKPGQVGSSIIAGHIDSQAGPGIFYHLHQLKRGEYVYVIRADHTVATFEVTRLRTYAKTSFPRDTVYGPVPDSELRLITCGGTFDYATGSYLSNVVVYAVLIR